MEQQQSQLAQVWVLDHGLLARVVVALGLQHRTRSQ
jgi:hypothetical protein